MMFLLADDIGNRRFARVLAHSSALVAQRVELLPLLQQAGIAAGKFLLVELGD